MDREIIEQRLLKIQEETRQLIDDAYICGYKDGYFECTCHKGMAMTGVYLSSPKEEFKTINLSTRL